MEYGLPFLLIANFTMFDFWRLIYPGLPMSFLSIYIDVEKDVYKPPHLLLVCSL